MILYLEASALVIHYTQEMASQDVNAWIEAADRVVTGLITRVEVAAAIARAGRMKLITPMKPSLHCTSFARIGRASIAANH